MTTDLHARIGVCKSWIAVLVVLVVGLSTLLVLFQERIHQAQAVQMGMITAAHQRHVEAEQLCTAVRDQEHIIRRELPLVQMSWTAHLKEICR